MNESVSFYLNGRAVTIENPAPDLLLIDYLRSPEVGLTGAKKGCGQGGCGACTVILSHWDEPEQRVEHRSINSCLRPVCALAGLTVTTIEGTSATARPAPARLHHSPSFSRFAALPMHLSPGLIAAAQEAAAHRAETTGRLIKQKDTSADKCEGMNPVAHRLAMNNGTQCGYCTTGFVMNMTAFLAANPKPTKHQIEGIFDGNICRCTGYRPILTGMKTFASDWTAEDEKNRMQCIGDDDCESQCVLEEVSIPFLPEAKRAPEPVQANSGRQAWVTPTTLDELRQLMSEHRAEKFRLVHGNTSYGIYKEEVAEAELLVDIRLIPELYGVEIGRDEIQVGASSSYSHFIEVLEQVLEARGDSETTRLGAAHFMARRTAGMIVRNAASLGGNSMLVLKHIYEGEPFPSDLFTVLVAIDAKVVLRENSSGDEQRMAVAELINRVCETPTLADDIVLVRYHIPFGDKDRDIVLAQKVALRQVNAHSLVNSTVRFTLGEDLTVEEAVVVYGGIAPYPWRPRETEAALKDKPLTLQDFPALAKILTKEVRAELERWQERMAGLVSEGITNEYRVALAVSFLYKAVVNALVQRDPGLVPEDVRSSGEITWGHWPISDGKQSCKVQDYKAPVSQPYIKIMAMYQASGQVHYTHEIDVPPTAVNAAFVQSRRALADYYFVRPGQDAAVTAEELRVYLKEHFAAFIDLITYKQIPKGGINYQGMGLDQPLFAVKRVSYVGQAIALVIATTEQEAIKIADYVTKQCVGYELVDWPEPWNEPVLSLDQAIARGSVFPDYPESASFVSHIWKIIRPGSRFDWTTPDKDPLQKDIVLREGNLDDIPCTVVDGIPCTVVESTQATGGQIHFYMETQACVAAPVDGECLLIQPSTQSPMEMHQTAAMAIGVEHNRIEVSVRQVGGAYGGKTEPARFVTGPTAVAARALQKTVRLVMPRDEDSGLIGKRHPYYGQYQIAVDRGEVNPEDRGLIRGIQTKMWGDGGAFYDCSFVVSNCIQLRADNAYKVNNFENQIDVCRTNTAPNTAFRAFGDIQGTLIIENAIDDAAFALQMPAEELREKNFYDRGDVTPFGQALSYCYMKDVWSYLKEVSSYETKKQEVEAFNSRNKWRKRGLAMVPVKYGSGYNFVQLEQAMAYIAVYAGDGTVVIHQGGVDMGQGMMTKVEQVAAYVLNVPMDMIRIEGPSTSVTPNPSSTGASTGTAYNGEAVKRTCESLRERLTEFGYRMLKEHGDHWCSAPYGKEEHRVDFWNFKEGWAAEIPGSGGTPKLIWQNLIAMAYQQRVDLVAHFTAPIAGGTTPVPAMTFKPKDKQPNIPGIKVDQDAPPGGAVDSFVGFTYSAACSVVELDVLTGEVKILSADLVYDMGWSLHPAIDIGQVEGAFVQGIGYVLTEKLVFEPDGPEQGRLNTVNTWRYKPPAITTIPLEMNLYLFPRDLAAEVPENPHGLFSSKEVGEPPLVLASSVFFALKAAIRASRVERGLEGLFRLDAPATVQEVRRACAVSNEELG
jgi:xanthine dehydrogenase/oxidase